MGLLAAGLQPRAFSSLHLFLHAANAEPVAVSWGGLRQSLLKVSFLPAGIRVTKVMPMMMVMNAGDGLRTDTSGGLPDTSVHTEEEHHLL